MKNLGKLILVILINLYLLNYNTYESYMLLIVPLILLWGISYVVEYIDYKKYNYFSFH